MPAVLHVDMDAFYASVEMRSRPELRRVPMWVGGERRGVVLSANYPARSFGVAAGMPAVRARQLCPQGVAIRPDFASYAEVSTGVRAVLETVSAWVSMASVDEAYLRFPASAAEAVDVGERVRAMIFDEQGITCSVGIGPNRLIAKMASVAAKPDGLVEVAPEQVDAFLAPLPVERLVGVGPAMAARLHRLGVRTVADVTAVPTSALRAAFGPRSGTTLAEAARGRDTFRSWAEPGERGMGCQETLWEDVAEIGALRGELLGVCERVATRMRSAGVVGRTVTAHLRFADFTVRSTSMALAEPTDSTTEIYAVAMGLLGRLWRSRRPVRRVGVRVTGLKERAQVWIQPRLDDPDCGWPQVEAAADAANRVFGDGAVRRAALFRGARGEHLS